MQHVDDGSISFGAIERLQLMQQLQRVWRPHLTASERDFLAYLIDNTVNWNRSVLRATIDQMIDGTDWGLPRIGMSRRSVIRVLGTLRKHDLVQTKVLRGRVTQFTINLRWTPQMLRVPKRLKKQPTNTSARPSSRFFGEFEPALDSTSVARDEKISPVPDWHTSSAKLAHVQCQIGTPNKESKKEREAEKDRAALRGHEPGEPSAGKPKADTAAEAIAATAQKRAARAAARRASGSTSTRALWADAWLPAFPGTPCPLWKAKDHGIMGRLHKRVEGSGVNWADFVTYAVSEWRSLCRVHFAWMTTQAPPIFPEPRFLAGFADRFLDAYLERDRTAQQSTKTGQPAELARLLAAGMTQEQALIELGKREAMAQHREEIERDKAEVGRLFRAAERAAAGTLPVVHRPRVEPEVRIVHGENPYDSGAEVTIPNFDRWEDGNDSAE